jgi:hypothetical protein
MPKIDEVKHLILLIVFAATLQGGAVVWAKFLPE